MTNNTQDKAFYEDGYIWSPINEVLQEEYNGLVYNLEVEEDNSYVVQNIIVHNCTDISCAGKQKGFLDEDGNKTRSGMYYEGIRILRYKKPALSIIENVKNLTGKRFKKEFETILSDLDEIGYNTYWKVLNAKDFGIPQNRERVFIISIRKDLDNGKFEFPKGFDNGVRLKDVLEDEVDEKYYISDDKVQRFLTNLNTNISLLYDPCQVKREGKSREYNDYCPTLTSRDYKDPRLVNANVVKQTVREDRGMSNRKSEGTSVLETPDYSYCLDANYYKGTTIEQYVEKHRRQLVSEKENSFVKEQIRIRKLTPMECFRLMGFDDSAYEAASKVVSNSQLYKQSGNSIVVDVLYYILVELYKAMPYLFDDLKLSSFFSGIGAFESSLDLLYERNINYDRSELNINRCEICGSNTRVKHNQLTNMFLCEKHCKQIYKYGNITDNSSYNQKDKNDIKVYKDYALLILKNKYGEITGKSIIDLDDIEIVKQYKWTLGNHGYVTSGAGKNQILLHRLLSNAFDGIYVDHINRNKLDNRKLNYRFCTNQENNRNKDLYSHNSSGITGVTWNKERNKWQAQIVVDNKTINLGRYESFDEAVKARLKGEEEYFKDFMPQERTGLYESINTGNFTKPQVE